MIYIKSYRATTNLETDCTIWEALYATMERPDLLKIIELNDGPVRQSCVGGELGCRNPIAHVLAKVSRLYLYWQASCILSIAVLTYPIYLSPSIGNCSSLTLWELE